MLRMKSIFPESCIVGIAQEKWISSLASAFLGKRVEARFIVEPAEQCDENGKWNSVFLRTKEGKQQTVSFFENQPPIWSRSRYCEALFRLAEYLSGPENGINGLLIEGPCAGRKGSQYWHYKIYEFFDGQELRAMNSRVVLVSFEDKDTP